MNRRATLSFLLAAALASCTTPTAAPVAPTQAEWDAITANDYTCTKSETVAASFEAVLAAPQAYADKCLRLRALFAKGALYRDAGSLATARPPGHPHDGMIGVAAKDAKLLAGLSTHPQFVTASGRLRSCAERARRLQDLADRATAAAKPGDAAAPVSTLDGFCRDGGVALYVTAIDAIPTAMD